MTRDPAPPVPRSSRRRTLLTIAALTVVGPMFAILPVSMFVAVGKMTASSQMSLSEPLGLMLFGLILGYVLAWPYALLTGVIVAAWSWWRRPSFLVAIGAALVANVILHFAGSVLQTSLWLREYSAFRLQESIIFSLVVVSICWLIFRRVTKLAPE
jgi:predicted membrane protein